MLALMPDAVIVCDGDGRIVFVNQQAVTLTGYTRRELIGQKIEMLVPARMRRGHAKQRRAFYMRGMARRMGTPDRDFWLQRKDGDVVAVDIALGPAGQDTVAVLRDITRRREMEAALEHRALHDPLTNLANRTLFFDRLRQSMLAARRESGQVGLAMLDVDGFKAVNDAHGHAVGDELLTKLARRLGEGLRATDTAARIGGDEFAWIFPRVSSRAQVLRMVRRRIASATKPLVFGDEPIKIGLSAGIAIYPDDGRDADALMRRADAALYTAKTKRGGVVST